jgi:hypothetical protein
MSSTQSTQYSASQQVNFAKNSDPAQGISLCIPRVFNNISHFRIKKHIIEANLGFVERVDVIPVAGGKFKRAFVHFAPNKWNMRDATSRAALKALQEGKKIKLEYEAPWYWIVGISGAERPKEAPKPYERKTQVHLTVRPSASALAMGEYDPPALEEGEITDAPKLVRSPKLDMDDPIVARARENTSKSTNDGSQEQATDEA